MAACRPFVCVADEVWRLQRGSEADCVFFQRAVNGGRRITDRGTRQGTWVLSPGGQVLAQTNARDPDAILAVLARGLEAWRNLPPAARRLPEGVAIEPAHRWERSYPQDGLVLQRISRELGPKAPAGDRSAHWNRDFVWFDREELAGMLPPGGIRLGARFELPLVAHRLARFHFVDDVRGQGLPYAAEEVQRAELTAEAIARVGNTVVLALRGSTLANSDGRWKLGDNAWKPPSEIPHGIETRMVGRAGVDTRTGRLNDLELVAVARFWGRTPFNGRSACDAEGRLGFWIAPDPRGRRIPPAFVAVYDAPWVLPPAVATWLESPAECGLHDADD